MRRRLLTSKLDVFFPFSDVRKRLAAKKQTLQDKNPQDLLNDIIEGVKYCFLTYPNGEHECLAKIEGQFFSGKGSSQRAARFQSITKILKNIFDISIDQSQTIPILTIAAHDKFGDIMER